MFDNISGLKPTKNEGLKAGCPTLAGRIAETLSDESLDHFTDEDYEFLKFHGIYQQDDRDLRKSGKKYMFMVRGRLPGGWVTPEQYLAFDRVAAEHGNDTLRITSRQGFQFHGVVKAGLRPLIREIHEVLADTLAACGDVNRNVMAPPTPARDGVGEQVQADARRLAEALLPRTRAYHQIWLEGVEVTPTAPEGYEDPLYGRAYLPRKFKTGFVVPPLNDVDIYTQCLGLVAIAEGGRLLGYDLLAGGGQGRSHNNAATFPRLADAIGFFAPDRLVEVARAVLTVHRDFGDRTNRKHARLKYVLEERGVDWFRGEVERRTGMRLEPVRPFVFECQGDLLGWHRQSDGRMFLGLFVESGRIRDRSGEALKKALAEVVEEHRPKIRLTPSQNLYLTDIAEGAVEAITEQLFRHGVSVVSSASPTRRASMACPALPTCGLALAESERFLPELLERIEALLAELGLAEEGIVVRMTGCPNGCVRPYMAEIGLVGRAPGRYQVYLGGNLAGTRLNRVYRESVKEADLAGELREVLERFARDRRPGERFGDWCHRAADFAGATS